MDAKELEQRSLEELLELYLARFGQQFPIMLCRTMEDEKVKGSIVKVSEIENRGKLMAAGYQEN